MEKITREEFEAVFPEKTENEKYAFRCFLLRLGFIGTEYKKQRKILLSRLNGSSAFKVGKPTGDEQAKEA